MNIAYCIKCGNKFPKEALFCPYCGAKVFRPGDNDTDITPEDVIVSFPSDTQTDSIDQNEITTSTDITDGLDSSVKEESDLIQEVDTEVSSQENISLSEPEDEEEMENASIGMCILSFFIPLAGYIAAMSNKKSSKNKARTYALWATIGFVFNLIMKIAQASI